MIELLACVFVRYYWVFGWWPAKVSVACCQVRLLCHTQLLQVLHSFLILTINMKLPFSSWAWPSCYFFLVQQRQVPTFPLMWAPCQPKLPHSFESYFSKTLLSSSFPFRVFHHYLNYYQDTVNCSNWRLIDVFMNIVITLFILIHIISFGMGG